MRVIAPESYFAGPFISLAKRFAGAVAGSGDGVEHALGGYSGVSVHDVLCGDGQYVYYWGRYPRNGVLPPGWSPVVGGGGDGVSGSTRAIEVPSNIRSSFRAPNKICLRGAVAGFGTPRLYRTGIGFYPVGYLLAGLSVTVVAYAIARYELMDISFVPSRPKVMLSIKLAGLIPAYMMILLVIRIFTGTFHYLFAGVLFGSLSLCRVVWPICKGSSDRPDPFRERYDAYDTLVQFSKSLVAILS